MWAQPSGGSVRYRRVGLGRSGDGVARVFRAGVTPRGKSGDRGSRGNPESPSMTEDPVLVTVLAPSTPNAAAVPKSTAAA